MVGGEAGRSENGGVAGSMAEAGATSAAAGTTSETGVGGGGVAGDAGSGGEAPYDWSWLNWPEKTHPPAWDGSIPTDGVCSVDRFCWNDPYQSTNGVIAIWSSSPTDVWVAGGQAILAHYDGAKWTGITAIEDNVDFRLLSGTSGASDNVWTVGSTHKLPAVATVIYRFDGSKWHKMQMPNHEPVSIWATGKDEAWAAEKGGFVGHWDGSAWQETNVGGDVKGIYGFSDSDIWTTGDKVQHFDGASWKDLGGGGPTIWGPTSGDMWTGDGAHLVGGKWVPLAGAANAIFQVIGTSPTNMYFAGDAGGKSYYQLGQGLKASSFQAGRAVWPVAASDYWVTGGPTHGALASTPSAFTAAGTSLPLEKAKYVIPNDFDGIDTFSNGEVRDAFGATLKVFDAPFYYPAITGETYPAAWNDQVLWVCNNGSLYRYAAAEKTWSRIPGGPECWRSWLQTDGDNRLWLLGSGVADVYHLWVYDGAWHELPIPGTPPLRTSEQVPELQLRVRGHEAWIDSYRLNAHGWELYRTGSTLPYDYLGSLLCITPDDRVYLGLPDLDRQTCKTTNVVYTP